MLLILDIQPLIFVIILCSHYYEASLNSHLCWYSLFTVVILIPIWQAEGPAGIRTYGHVFLISCCLYHKSISLTTAICLPPSQKVDKEELLPLV